LQLLLGAVQVGLVIDQRAVFDGFARFKVELTGHDVIGLVGVVDRHAELAAHHGAGVVHTARAVIGQRGAGHAAAGKRVAPFLVAAEQPGALAQILLGAGDQCAALRFRQVGDVL
jgi:hypothetical protein